MNLNVRSLFVFSQTIARLSMIPRRQGRIINIASIAGLAGNPSGLETIAYNTSKGAVVNFTGRWRPNGASTTSTSTRSRRVSSEQDDPWHAGPRGAEALAAAAPLRRLGDDDDLKGAALLLASDAGKHITGQILVVDGGVSCVIGQ